MFPQRRRGPAVAGGALQVQLGVAAGAGAPVAFAGRRGGRVAIAVGPGRRGGTEFEYVDGVGGGGNAEEG